MTRILLTILTLFALFAPAKAQQDKIPIIFDTDIGTDIDDSFALALILASPELELQWRAERAD